MRLILLLALAGCIGEDPVTPEPQPEPEVVEPEPAAVPELAESVTFEVDVAHAKAVGGSPALAASYASVVEALGEARPATERMEAVVALRTKAMDEVPAEDGSSEALRKAYDEAVSAAVDSFMLAYAYAIVEGDGTSDDKAAQIEGLEAALVKTGYDWDLASRDALQAKLMMALRSAG